MTGVQRYNLAAGIVAALLIAWLIWLSRQIDVDCLATAAPHMRDAPFAPEVPAECIAQ